MKLFSTILILFGLSSCAHNFWPGDRVAFVRDSYWHTCEATILDKGEGNCWGWEYPMGDFKCSDWREYYFQKADIFVCVPREKAIVVPEKKW